MYKSHFLNSKIRADPPYKRGPFRTSGGRQRVNGSLLWKNALNEDRRFNGLRRRRPNPGSFYDCSRFTRRRTECGKNRNDDEKIYTKSHEGHSVGSWWLIFNKFDWIFRMRLVLCGKFKVHWIGFMLCLIIDVLF